MKDQYIVHGRINKRGKGDYKHRNGVIIEN